MRRLVTAALVVATAACGGNGGSGDAADSSETGATTGEPATGSTPTSSSAPTSTPEDTGTNAESSATTEATTTGPSDCEGGDRCLAAPPEGWLGPIARFRGPAGEEPPPCGEGYPDDGFPLYEGFAAPAPAECACSCSVHVSTVCSISMYPDVTSTSCIDFSVFIMNGAECTDYEIPSGSLYGSLFMQGTPSCIADDPVELPEVTWEADVYACSGVELGHACNDGDGVCTPRPPGGYDDKLCIFAQGENECPAGPFSEKSVLFSSVNDDRGCSQCECGPAPVIDCNGTFDLYDTAGCSGSVVGTAPTNGCSGPVGGVASIHVNLDDDTTCTVAKPSVAEGSAEPSGLFTYCCEG